MGARARAIAIGGLAVGLYLSTLSRWYSADSLKFANAVDSSNPADRLDVYHLFLHPLGWLWVELWRFGGWTGPSIQPLQVLNALAGGIAIALVAAIAMRTSGSTRAGTLAALGCTVSGGMWVFATEAEDVTLGLCAHLAVLRLILQLEAGGPRRLASSCWLGVALALATLTYINCAMLLAVAALAHWQGRTARPRWLRSFVATCAAFAAVVVAAMVIAGVVALPTSGSSYGTLSRETIPRGLYAFLRTLVLFPQLGINDSTATFLRGASTGQRAALITTYAVTAVVVVTALRALRRMSPLHPLHQRLLLWVTLFASFAFWWVPSDLEFWLPVTVAWWIAIALVVAHRAIDPRAAATLVVALLLLNGLGLIRQHRKAEANAPLQAALHLGQALRPGDVVIASPVMDEFLTQFVRRGNLRSTANQLDGIIARAKARMGAEKGRLFVAGFDLSAAERPDRHQRLVSNARGYSVWELLPNSP